jgi:hypothetical protein
VPSRSTERTLWIWEALLRGISARIGQGRSSVSPHRRSSSVADGAWGQTVRAFSDGRDRGGVVVRFRSHGSSCIHRHTIVQAFAQVEYESLRGAIAERLATGSLPPDEAYWWTRILSAEAVMRLSHRCTRQESSPDRRAGLIAGASLPRCHPETTDQFLHRVDAEWCGQSCRRRLVALKPNSSTRRRFPRIGLRWPTCAARCEMSNVKTMKMLAFLPFVLLMTGCASPKPVPHAPQAVQTQRVGFDPAVSGGSSRYSAVVEPEAEVPLSFRIPGYVIALQQGAPGDVAGRCR